MHIFLLMLQFFYNPFFQYLYPWTIRGLYYLNCGFLYNELLAANSMGSMLKILLT